MDQDHPLASCDQGCDIGDECGVVDPCAATQLDDQHRRAPFCD
jgi:hypothetical protein